MDPLAKITKWLEEQLAKTRPLPVERVELSLLDVNGRVSAVASCELSAKQMAGNVDAGAIAGELFDAAQEDAAALGGVQKYQLALHSSKQKKQLARVSFHVAGIDDEDDDRTMTVSEPATGSGLLAQLMRHNEGTLRATLASTTAIASMQARQIERLEKQNLDLLADRVAQIKVFEELMSQRHMRDVELKQLEAENARKDKAIEKISPLVPIIFNRLAGRAVLPTSIQGSEFEQFANSIRPEQFQQLQGVLDAEQQLRLVSILEQLRSGDAGAGANGATKGNGHE